MTGERRLFFERYTDAWNDHDPSLDGPISRAEVADFVTETVAAFPDVRFTERRVITDGSNRSLVLTAEWTMTGSHDGSFQGLPPAGEAVEIDGVDVVTITDEGITSITGYFDQSAVMDQLGLTFPTVLGKVPTLAAGAVRAALS